MSLVTRLWRYYQAGLVNTAFGYGLFAALVAIGLNMYMAQIVAHVCGVVFNYFTYSRYTFRDLAASRLRFVLSYGLNYVLGLSFLWLVSHLTASAYLAGLASVIVVSAINFLVLKRFVYTERVQA